MTFSVVKLMLALLIAFVLGVSLGWLLRSRGAPQRHASGGWPGDARIPEPSRPPAAGSPPSPPAPQPPPPTPPPAAKTPDDLKRIHGVGPALERTLNGLGVTRFEQIAAWTRADVERIDEHLRFRGRIERDDWIGQARELAARAG